MMFGRNVEKVTDRHGTAYLFDMMKPYFDNADYSSGNFENPILKDDEENYEKIDKQIHLHTGADAIHALKELDFTMVNLANNHMMDFGEQGLQDTVDELDAVGLNHVGAGKNVEEATAVDRSEEHTSELQSRGHLVCRLL